MHRCMVIRDHRSLSQEVREIDSFGSQNRLHKFLRIAGFYVTARNPPIVHLELVSGYLNCLSEFGELEFPLILTLSLPPSTGITGIIQ